MSLNNIELPDSLIAELYKDTLISSPDGSSATYTRPPAKPVAPAQADPVPPASRAKVPANLPAPSTSPASSSPSSSSPSSTSSVSSPAQTAQSPLSPAASTSSPAASPASPASATPYKFLGDNRRRITILVPSPDTAFLPDDHLAFLTRILEACQMNIGDVAIVNHSRTPVVISTLRQQLQPSVILLFGIDPVAIKLPIQFPVFKIQSYDDCTYLCTPALEELVANTHEGRLQKSKLWICLQTLFNV